MLEVVEPGLLSTIQDAGRPWAADLGVPRSGACDPLALRALQRLMSSAPAPDPTMAVLEVSLLGPTLVARQACVVALTGADLSAEVIGADDASRPVRPGTTVLLRETDTLRFGDALDGCRAYVGLPGGIDVPLVFGSRSTCLAGGFGGIEGRALRTGDLLRPVLPGTAAGGLRWPGLVAGRTGDRVTVLRAVAGPHAGLFPASALARLAQDEWTVSTRSDRMGARLEGVPIDVPATGELISLPMRWGAVQVPPTGLPIVLLADHQTVGGYPVPLVVASVDLPVLGQLRATDAVRFELIELEAARTLRLRADAEFAAVEKAFVGSLG